MIKSVLKNLAFIVVATSLWWGFATAQDWTFMVYLDADNNLEGAGIDDFAEMATVGSDANVNIVVQFDRIGANGDVDDYDDRYDNWTTCKRFYVTSGMVPDENSDLQDIGECNMGDPDTLTSFIDWGTTTYPADHYALILWNHGGGWRERQAALKKALEAATSEAETRAIASALSESSAEYKAVCWDDTNSGDSLFMSEVQSALADAVEDMDLIGFDACFMGMMEVAYELKDSGASVMVGSEETEDFGGWPYDAILGDLRSNPSWGPDAFGIDIVNCYDASYTNDYTQAAIDLTTIGDLGDTVSSFADSMVTNWDSNKYNVGTAAQAVMDKMDAAVLEEAHGASLPDSYGLAIYFPATQGDFNPNYNSAVDFSADTSWDEFLSDFYGEMGGSWIETARSSTQEFSQPEHIDLYHFCLQCADQAAMVADAGADQSVNDGDVVMLDGSGSSVPGGGVPIYFWEQESGPSVILSDDTTAQPTFTSPVVENAASLTFRLTVSDGHGLEAADTCRVWVNHDNESPVADAGDDQAVDEGDRVTLDASGSTDPDDGIVVYLWEQIGGAAVTLSDSSALQPTFTAPDVADDGDEVLTFRLTVTDAGGLSASDTSTVDVAAASSTRSSSGGGGCFIGSVL
jgi:hypothetical protein